jgi:hypothetical protein
VGSLLASLELYSDGRRGPPFDKAFVRRTAVIENESELGCYPNHAFDLKLRSAFGSVSDCACNRGPPIVEDDPSAFQRLAASAFRRPSVMPVSS